jgi:hypothetical protein
MVNRETKIQKAHRDIDSKKKQGYYYINENDVIVLCTQDQADNSNIFKGVTIHAPISNAVGAPGEYMAVNYAMYIGQININQD